MDLELIRHEIDAVDRELVALLEKRMTLVNQVAAYKQATGKAVLDCQREKQVLETIARQVVDKRFENSMINTFSDIMKHSRAYQETYVILKNEKD